MPRRRPIGAVLRAGGQVILALALLAFFLHYLRAHPAWLDRVIHVGPGILLALSATVWLEWLVAALQTQTLLTTLNRRAPLGWLALVAAASNCLNYLPVQSGPLGTAVWLRRFADLRYSRFLSLWVAVVAMVSIVGGAAGVVGLIGSHALSDTHRWLLLAAFGWAVVIPIVLALRPPLGRRRRPGRIGRQIARWVIGVRRIRQDRRALVLSLLLQTSRYALRGARLWLALAACGAVVGAPEVCVLLSLATCAALVIVTPGSLGVREGAVAVGGVWLALPAGAGAAAAALDRAITLLWVLVVGLPAVIWLARGVSRPPSLPLREGLGEGRDVRLPPLFHSPNRASSGTGRPYPHPSLPLKGGGVMPSFLERVPLVLRMTVYYVVFLGFILGLLPWLAGQVDSRWPAAHIELGWFRLAGVALWLACLVQYTRAAVHLARQGKGAYVEFDPPRSLVRDGPFRWCRNPIAACVLGMLLGEAIALSSTGVLLLALVAMLVAHAQVVLLEEPLLRQRFGRAYAEYSARVPRWIPRRLKPTDSRSSAAPSSQRELWP